MSDQIKMSLTLPVPPKVLYEAWLDSDKHSDFSEKNVKIEKMVGSAFYAEGGIVEGKVLEIIRNRKITHSWNSAEFPEGSEESKVEVSFEAVADSTKMTIVHSNLPEGEGKKIRKEWRDKYFTKMKKYFAEKAD
ncbi:MAG: SRPBCC domain-containing protein [Melioribacteraceae bacterium]|nr:SRPBCC domain-containing protein [Melioribacteraceae bacterium]